jgi:hypothetical protein
MTPGIIGGEVVNKDKPCPSYRRLRFIGVARRHRVHDFSFTAHGLHQEAVGRGLQLTRSRRRDRLDEDSNIKVRNVK